MRLLGLFSVVLGTLAIIGQCMGLALPTARWFFDVSREVPFLKLSSNGFLWFGWLSSALLILGGLHFIVRSFASGPANPITVRRIRRFCQIKRGYYSLLILIALGGIAALDQTLVGNQALAVKYNGKWSFPAFVVNPLKNKDFGITDATAEAPADYRKLKRIWHADKTRRVIMPLIPFAPTGDTLPPRSQSLSVRDGIYYEGSNKTLWGLAAKYHDVAEGKMQIRYTLRKGVLNGPADGWDAQGQHIYTGIYQDGVLISDHYTGTSDKEAFLTQRSGDLRAVKYHPAPPIFDQGNWLGTTSQGYDVLAYLYGGLQVNFKAALIYLPIVYLIGITLGMMMGYFGGWFDMLTQRLIEIFSNVPFLFIVIIFSSMVPEKFKGLPIILTILIAFGWMGMTYLMRTAAYRDKERDYISAAKVLGATTPRILFRHLLPNTVAIIVTLVPFTLSGLVSALTSLDYLGFGLPPEYATWGRLLNDGLSNLSAPWLVTSTFFVLVGLLVLITFIGEAVREAFDPKNFTYYR
ncbi:MAG: ABC transporter permease subunit [Gloeobacteraceae cyanobacterium ES-bin-144]|nr:ABC transporter permease subunit [Verrucomicrobiales bacterium]